MSPPAGQVIGLLGEVDEPAKEATVSVLRVPGAVESLEAILADRLEHPEAWFHGIVAALEQALVEQRLDRVQVRAGNMLRGREGATADETSDGSSQLDFRCRRM